MKAGIFAVFCLLFAHVAAAEEVVPEAIPGRLAAIQQAVADQKAALASISETLRRRESEVKALSAEIAKAKTRFNELEADITVKESESRALEAEIRQTEIARAKREQQAVIRIRSAYMHRPARLVPLVWEKGAAKDAARFSYFLERIHRFDQESLHALARLEESLAQKDLYYRRALEELRRLREDHGKERDRLERAYARAGKVAAELRADQKRAQAELTALRAQALRLETVVASITRPAEGGELMRARLASPRDAVVEKFDGSGLPAKGKGLVKPIDGRLVRAFGKKRSDPGFEGAVFERGVQFLGSGDVRAVWPGKVVFAGRMPAFGNVVIVDHGHSNHTLYALLGSISVKRGDVLTTGEKLGEAASVDGEANLHFEIREKGTAVNPGRFFPNL